LHPLDLGLVLGADGLTALTRDGRRAQLPDLVFTRMGAACPAAGLHVLLQLKAAGVPVINDPSALWLARDKVRCALVLACAGLPLPKTLVPGRHVGPDAVAAELGPPPWVIKRPEGSKGEAVYLVRTAVDLSAHLSNAETPLVVQRFVAEASGTDLRVLVIGGRAVAAMRRRSSDGDFRSNLHLGGTAEAVALEPELAQLAERATETLGLDVAGVDLVESSAGLLVIEVNGSPGLRGIEDATGLDLSAGVIALLEERQRNGGQPPFPRSCPPLSAP